MGEQHDFAPDRVLHLLPDPVLLLGPDGVLLWANQAAEEAFGWGPTQRIGESVIDLVHPDDQNVAILSMSSVQDQEVGTPLEVRVRTADGDFRLAEVRGRSALDDDSVGAIILVVRDLTDRRRWELARGDERVFQVLLEYATTITVLLDPSGKITSTNSAVARQLGIDALQVEGQPFHCLVPDDAAEVVRDTVAHAAQTAGITTFETALRTNEGGSVPHEVSIINLIHDPVVNGLVVTAHDISELDSARNRLVHLATHDPLTGLPNRLLFEDRLAHALEGAARRNTRVAVFFCDLDGFKRVNDEHGHATGDEVLVETGRRLARVVRSADSVARLGGDEFVVLAEDVDEDMVKEIATRLEEAFNDPLRVLDHRVQLRLSVGWEIACGDAASRAVLAQADAAMYRRKAAQRRGT